VNLTTALAIVAVVVCAASNPTQAKPLPLPIDCASIVASKSLNPKTAPCMAVDDDVATGWTSGSPADQWILIDLGRPHPINSIRLKAFRTAGASSQGWVTAGADLQHMKKAYGWKKVLQDGDWLEFSGDQGTYDGGNVRYVRIQTSAGAAALGWREIEIIPAVQVFAYFQDVTPVDDYMTETSAAGANTTFIMVQSVEDLSVKLAAAKSTGLKAIINIGDMVFQWVNGDPNTHHLVLNAPFWMDQWVQIKNLITAGDYRDTVVSLYLHDEPYLFGISREDLTTLAARLHDDFPEIATSAIVEYQTLIEPSRGRDWINMATPSGRSTLDWVGFDCYDQFSPCYGQLNMNVTMRGFVNSDQRLIAVPWACRNCSGASNGPGTNEAQAYMIDVNLNRWHAEILSDGKYVAVVPFMWQSVDGANGMPFVTSRLGELSRSLLPHRKGQVFPVSTSASSTYRVPGDAGQNTAFAAIDNVTNDMWNSGCYANGHCPSPGAGDTGKSPWIQADFGGLTHLTSIQLVPSQDKPGQSTHQLLGTLDRLNFFPVGSLSQSTSDAKPLHWSGSVDVVALRVQTTQTPGWVAWKEISFFQD